MAGQTATNEFDPMEGYADYPETGPTSDTAYRMDGDREYGSEATTQTRVQSYGCCLCQQKHYDGEPLFVEHTHHQSKHGISYELPLTDEQRQTRDLNIIRRAQAQARHYMSIISDLRSVIGNGREC